MKQLRRIFLSFFITIATTIGIDLVFGKVADTLFVHSQRTKIQYDLSDHTDVDILIIGSSRALHHYDSPMMSDSMGCNVQTVAYSGRGLTFHTPMIMAILEHSAPKEIILELLPNELDGLLNPRIKMLYPYIPINKHISDIAIQVDSYNNLLLCSHLYRYNSQILESTKSLYSPYKIKNNGYLPLTPNNVDSLEEQIEEPRKGIDIVARNCLLDIMDLCEKKNIRLIVTMSPELYLRDNKEPIFEICKAESVEYLDNRSFRIQGKNNEEYFNDLWHLNSIGAAEYSKYFIQQLKNISSN